MNNNDKINAMTIEEKSNFIYELIMSCGQCPVNCKVKHIGRNKCPKAICAWLQQETTDDT